MSSKMTFCCDRCKKEFEQRVWFISYSADRNGIDICADLCEDCHNQFIQWIGNVEPSGTIVKITRPEDDGYVSELFDNSRIGYAEAYDKAMELLKKESEKDGQSDV